MDEVDVLLSVRIAEKAKQLRELGMSARATARALGISDKTVAKALSRRPC